jgi:S-formylglutathione hydrolase FrmB
MSAESKDRGVVSELAARARNTVVAAAPGAPGIWFVTQYSPALRRRADVSVFVPPGREEQALPLLILMHGVYGSHWNWWALGDLPAIAMEMMAAGEMEPFAIAMPSDGMWGDGSGYVTHRDLDAEAWIVDEVPECARAVAAHVQAERIFLAGLSMGGFGALRLGAKYAARVAGISAHSPVTSLADLREHVQDPLRAYFAEGRRDVDVLYWMRSNRAALPPIRFDCGTEDALLGSNRALHAALEKARIPHVYEESAGGHDWPYWQKQVRSTLRFFSEITRRGAAGVSPGA